MSQLLTSDLHFKVDQTAVIMQITIILCRQFFGLFQLKIQQKVVPKTFRKIAHTCLISVLYKADHPYICVRSVLNFKVN